jgi:hypothetical protein
MQVSCLDCYRKHIGTANAYENESHLGYPSHKWLAIGEICCAENEVLNKFPELAATTREYRKAYMDQGIPIPTLQLIDLATDLEKMTKIAESSENTKIDNK